jgi:hypothetical protein
MFFAVFFIVFFNDNIAIREVFMKVSAMRISLFAAAMMFAAALAGCGSGGGASSGAAGASGPAAVEVSIAVPSASGPQAAAVSVGGGSVPSADPSFRWPEEIREPSPQIAHVYMEVVKISLMPAAEPFESEDMDGELRDSNPPGPSDSADKPHFITVVPDPPVRIDLLRLENGKRFARLLNRFDSVPVGTYDKIRVHYRKVRVVLADNTTVNFHPTANSKFDIHFRQGHELVIPAATDTTQPDGWVRFFRVRLDVVGLKLRIVSQGNSWKGSKVILRPQIFAESVPPVLYSVAGTATIISRVSTPPVAGIFDVSFGTGPGYPRVLQAVFDNDTRWAFSDDVLARSSWIVDVANSTAVGAFRDGAKVEAIGPFDSSSVLRATEIVFTFPDVRQGTADNVWILDNTAFIVRSVVDNVVVIPKPDRFAAYYDNGTFPHLPLTQAAVDNNVQVKARGYAATGGIEAFWITVGEITAGP